MLARQINPRYLSPDGNTLSIYTSATQFGKSAFRMDLDRSTRTISFYRTCAFAANDELVAGCQLLPEHIVLMRQYMQNATDLPCKQIVFSSEFCSILLVLTMAGIRVHLCPLQQTGARSLTSYVEQDNLNLTWFVDELAAGQ